MNEIFMHAAFGRYKTIKLFNHQLTIVLADKKPKELVNVYSCFDGDELQNKLVSLFSIITPSNFLLIG